MRPTGWIRAHHRSCPEPGNHGSLASAIFFWQCYFRVEMSNALFCLVTHPLPIVAYVIAQSASAMPVTPHQRALRFWIDGWASGKLWRYLDQGFIDQHCDWIEITGVSFQAE